MNSSNGVHAQAINAATANAEPTFQSLIESVTVSRQRIETSIGQTFEQLRRLGFYKDIKQPENGNTTSAGSAVPVPQEKSGLELLHTQEQALQEAANNLDELVRLLNRQF